MTFMGHPSSSGGDWESREDDNLNDGLSGSGIDEIQFVLVEGWRSFVGIRQTMKRVLKLSMKEDDREIS